MKEIVLTGSKDMSPAIYCESEKSEPNILACLITIDEGHKFDIFYDQRT